MMTVAVRKSNVIHSRNPSVVKSKSNFVCGDHVLEIVECYSYLRLLLTEHFNDSHIFEITFN